MIRPPYADAPVPQDLLVAVLDAGRKAPSAGFTQGMAFVVLRGDETRRFWELTWPTEGGEPPQAPVVVLPLENKSAYLRRYGEADKNSLITADETTWPVPYWTVDCAFATMTVLLAANAHGLGAWFFGLVQGTGELLAELGVPADFRPIGAFTLGVRPDQAPRSGSVLSRPQKPLSERVHFGRWQASDL